MRFASVFLLALLALGALCAETKNKMEGQGSEMHTMGQESLDGSDMGGDGPADDEEHIRNRRWGYYGGYGGYGGMGYGGYGGMGYGGYGGYGYGR